MKSVLAFLPVAFAAISSTQLQTFDAEHMKETFKGIAAQSGEIDPTTKNNIQKILDLIQGNLTQALAQDYRVVIEEYEAQEKELEDCNDAIRECTDTHVANSGDDYAATQQSHANCRNFAHQVCSEKNSNCTLADNHVKNFATPAWPGVAEDDRCDGEDEGAVKSFMQNALKFVCDEGQGCANDDWVTCFNTVPPRTGGLPQKGCDAAARQARCTGGANGTYCEGCDYASRRANCGIATDLYSEQQKECTTLQRQLERDHCEFLEEGCQCCEVFFNCWSNKRSALDAERQRVIQVINLIHTQQEALECLLCYGAQILEAGTTDFEKCDRQGCTGCGPMPIPGSDLHPEFGTTGDCRESNHGSYPTVNLQFEPVPILDQTCPTDTSALSTCDLCTQAADRTATPYSKEGRQYEVPESESEPTSEPTSDVEPEPTSEVEPAPAVAEPEP